jgi:hypothetical protein
MGRRKWASGEWGKRTLRREVLGRTAGGIKDEWLPGFRVYEFRV